MKDIEKILEVVSHPKSERVKLSANSIRIRINSDVWFDFGSIPNDLNAIRELELLVIETVGRLKYGTELFRATDIDATSLFSFDSTLAVIGTTSTADAPTRIAAMLAALEGE